MLMALGALLLLSSVFTSTFGKKMLYLDAVSILFFDFLFHFQFPEDKPFVNIVFALTQKKVTAVNVDFNSAIGCSIPSKLRRNFTKLEVLKAEF